MKRPSGWMPNPQAMAAVSQRNNFTGSEALQSHAPDPDTWLTPRYILSELGEFDLDPCASLGNPQWTGAKQYLTIEEDGLAADWEGRVFMNPPFSHTAEWIRRHAKHGNGISLVPATVESVAWREVVWQRAIGVLLLYGRTRFCNPDGSPTTGRPLRSIALIGWTAQDAAVLKRCALAGVYLENWIQR